MRRFAFMLIALVVAALSTGPAVAQQGTPFAGREVPDPSSCTVEPRCGRAVRKSRRRRDHSRDH